MREEIVKMTPCYKQDNRQIVSFLASFYRDYKDQLSVIPIYGDSEFGIDDTKSLLKSKYRLIPYINAYGNSKSSSKLSFGQYREYKTVDRAFARFNNYYAIERPNILGDVNIDLYLQLCFLTDMLVAYHNLVSGNSDRLHSRIF